MAILFSAVSATALQYNGVATFTFAQTFNLFWVLSLMLSTVCAIQSQLVIYWQLSTSRPPFAQIPPPVLIAIVQMPAILLGSSACTFLIGLAIFVFAACDEHQRYFPIVVTVGICLAITYLVSFIVWVVVKRDDSGPRRDVGRGYTRYAPTHNTSYYIPTPTPPTPTTHDAVPAVNQRSAGAATYGLG